MLAFLDSFFTIKNKDDLGQKLFYIGFLFLPSALPITIICFLGALYISYKFNKIIFLHDIFDVLLLLSLLLIILGTIYTTYFNLPKELLPEDIFDIWISLFNWVPLFFIYWGFQSYLNSITKRLLTIKFLVAGTIPVLVSCIIQYFFNIYGPFKFFFNSIIWFNKPLSSTGGVTGLFSNPNYTGLFLTLTLPFLYFLNIHKKNSFKSKIILLFLTFLTLYFSIYTNSRNALIGILISLLMIINIKKIFYYFIFFTSGLYMSINLISNNLKDTSLYFKNLLDICAKNLSLSSFCKIFSNDIGIISPRTMIWISTISAIKDRPLFGWGGSTFFKVLPYKNIFTNDYSSTKFFHSHNIILEIAFCFGIPVALFLSISLISLLISAFNRLKFDNNLKNRFFNKAWLYSFLIILVSHLFDVTLYDAKISLIFVILLSGVRCIIENDNLLIIKTTN